METHKGAEGTFASVLPAFLTEGKEIRQASKPHITYGLDGAEGGAIWKMDAEEDLLDRHSFDLEEISATDWEASKSYSFHRDEFEGSDVKYVESLRRRSAEGGSEGTVELVNELMDRGWPTEDIRDFLYEGKTMADLPPRRQSAMELSSKNQTSSEGRLYRK